MLGWILISPMTQLFKSKWLNFFSRCTERKIESFWSKKLGRILVPLVTQFLTLSVHWEKISVILTLNVESLELRQKHLNWKKKTFIVRIGYPTDDGQSSIIAKAVNKQNTSKSLLYKLYFKMILKMIFKSFEFQCDFDFDFQITTSKMIWILILNHLYLGDLILILKSSTYNDFAHLWQ